MVSLKVAAEPVSGVHELNGETALCQLYVGPDDAGVPVEAAVELSMLIVAPAHIGELLITPAL